MLLRNAIAGVALAGALLMTVASAQAFDEARYPDWSGQWRKPQGIGNQWDQTKPPGRAQQAPLTAEYQAIFEASLARPRPPAARVEIFALPACPPACRG